MIQLQELRVGNYVLLKKNSKITPVQFDLSLYQFIENGGEKDVYPIVLKYDQLKKTGFVENMKYALLPDAHEYLLMLPVIGSNKNEIAVYVKNNKEAFGRPMLNGQVAGNNFYYLHQLQNLYFALTAQELIIKW